MQISLPWRADDRLQRELPQGHVLYGLPVIAVARQIDRDDVLFEIRDGTARVAVVHFTYAQEPGPDWPKTRLYSSIESWGEAMRTE